MTRPIILLLCGMVALGENTGAATYRCNGSGLRAEERIEFLYSAADIVVLAKVVAQEVVRPPRPEKFQYTDTKTGLENLDLFRDYMKSVQASMPYQEISFEVRQLWKGSGDSRLWARDQLEHGRLLALDVVYLVFAYKRPDGRYSVSTACGGVRLEDESSEQIEALNELTKASRRAN